MISHAIKASCSPTNESVTKFALKGEKGEDQRVVKDKKSIFGDKFLSFIKFQFKFNKKVNF